MAALRAPWRSEIAITPATTAAASSTPTPASSGPQAAVRAPLALGLTLAGGPALVEEGALEIVELAFVVGGPVERRGESGAAIELGRVAAGVAPLAGGADQVLVKVATLGVLGKPVAKARPLAEQRLVGDLGCPLVDGEQAALGRHTARARAAPSSRSSSSSSRGTRRRTNPSACSSSAPARRSSIGRARSRSAGLRRR